MEVFKEKKGGNDHQKKKRPRAILVSKILSRGNARQGKRVPLFEGNEPEPVVEREGQDGEKRISLFKTGLGGEPNTGVFFATKKKIAAMQRKKRPGSKRECENTANRERKERNTTPPPPRDK